MAAMTAGPRAPVIASFTLACVLVGGSHQARAQNSYSAAELQPLSGGTLTAVKGLDATGRAVGTTNVSKGLKWDILTGFYVKYDYLNAVWEVSAKATRAVRANPVDFEVQAVNGAGTMVGRWRTGPSRAVVMDRNGQVLHELPQAASYMPAINASGWVAGAVRSETGKWQAAFWREGQLTLLPLGGYQQSEATALNAQGQIVGYLLRTNEAGDDIGAPVRWTNGQIDWIGPEGAPPGPNTNIGATSNATTALGIDDKGRVLYRIDEPDGQGDRKLATYLRNPDGGIVQPTLPSGATLFVSQINGKGDALAYSGTRGAGGVPYMLRADGSVIDLAQWGKSGKIKLPAGAGTIARCGSLNEAGMMVCETEVRGLFGLTLKYFRVLPNAN